ncbi:MAG: UvrD-helicase domain-containing protein [Bacteroidales bacterium]|nr:UvrD-helicase domain-containing protein [Bacteroidales bacterium]
MPQKNFTVYRSSAGSGKTFTLVKEYLKLVLADDDCDKFRSILAITFTNKAAGEMKQRVIDTLFDLPVLKNEQTKNLLEQIKNELNIDANIIQARAKNILNTILHNYSDFAIGTIDSFTHKIIRSFANDLKVGFNFEVELDEELILEHVISILLNKAGSDEDITKALVEFIESKIEDEKSWKVENDILAFSKNLFKEDTYSHFRHLKSFSIKDFLELRSLFYKKMKLFEGKINDIGKKGIDIIKLKNIEFADFFHGESGLPKYFEKLARFDGDVELLVPNSYVTGAINDDKFYTKKIDEPTKKLIDEIKPELISIYENARQIIEKEKSDYVLFSLINRSIYEIALLNEIEKLIEEYKKQPDKTHISEFNKLISDIVINEPVPFIYERIGVKYHHFLIDEFQDTSVMQWQNFLPLIENSLANSDFNMVVGDGKQAIYRWRSGEVEQFSNLPEIYKPQSEIISEKENILKQNYIQQKLDVNRRSKKAIVEFNNDFFGITSEQLNDKYKKIYEDVKQLVKKNSDGGYVGVDFIAADEYEGLTLVKILNVINEAKTDGYELSDIAILCRSNDDATKTAVFLLENDVNVVSSESLLLCNSPDVCFVVSFMKLLMNEEDNIAKAEILRYLADKNHINTDYKEIFGNTVKLNVAEFTDFLKKNNFEVSFSELLDVNIYDITEKLVNIFKLNIKSNIYIQFFLDLVLEYSSRFNDNLSDFLVWWEEVKEKKSLAMPEEINAVRIMTIHKAKGLQFPVVILPFAGWKTNRLTDYVWLNVEDKGIKNMNSVLVSLNKKLLHSDYSGVYEEEENKTFLDELNVLYVAMTRPEERLYVFTKSDGKKDDISGIIKNYFVAKGDYNENKTLYELGTKTPKVIAVNEKKESNENVIRLNSFIYNNWHDKVLLRKNAPDLWNDEAFLKKQRGVLIHDLLSEINAVADVEPAVNSIHSEGLLKSTEKEKLKEEIILLLSNPEIKPYFKEGIIVKSEKEIIKDGRTYRPDRIILKNNLATVIDFKTGKEEEKHKKQINEYAGLLKDLGYEVEERVLIYIDEGRVVKVAGNR